MCKKSLLMMLLLALLAPWAAQAQEELTVYDGDATNGNVPVYGFYADAYNKAEMIMSADELSDMAGGTINGLTWYLASPAEEAWGGNFQVYLAEVTDATFTTFLGVDGATLVWEGPLDGTGSTIELEFTNEYTYGGDNLFIAVYQSATGTYKSASFAGSEVASASISNYSYTSLDAITSGTVRNFLPKTTFTYTPSGSGVTCARPTGLAINYTGGTTAEVSWISDATAWNIDVNGTVTAITTNPYTLPDLELGTAYTVKVQADCGGGDLSDWSGAKSFTTDLCLPENMCELRYDLVDSYGDGWNGNAIKVVDAATGAEIANLTIASGSSASGRFAVCDGRAINFVWVSGSYPSETSYTFYDINNDEIFSGSAGSGLISDYTVNCTPAACQKPQGLTVSYTGGTEATISWTSDAEAWNMRVNGTEINGTITNPYTLTGLELSTTYEVEVQANCGDATSDWVGPVSFTTDDCMPEDQIVVNYTLTDSYGDGWNGNYILVVDENCNIVNQLTIESGNSATGTLRVCGSYVQFLWYKGNYPTETSWVFTDNAGNVLFEGAGSADMASLDVLYTIDNNPYSAPTDVAVSEVGPRSAKLSWTETGTATAWQILITAGDDEEGTIIDANSNPFVITGLTPETEYFAQVRATGANGTSIWTCLGADFTTTEACPAPANLTATRVTATSATLNWEGFADTYNVSYAPVAHGEVIESNNFDDSSMGGWTTIDADADGYDWVLGSACGGVYLEEGSSLAGTGHESSADMVVSGSYSNIEGVGALNPDNYLVSPQVALGGSINFWACGQDASYAAEHFGVAVSTTGNTDASDFTTIWSTTLTAKGGNDRGGNATMIVKGGAKANPGTTRSGNRAQGNWYHFTIDLSDYSGQGYVAIRHFGCTDQFMLDVDDIVIEGPATTDVQWIDLTGVSENSIDIDGLEAETEYMWKVQANCGAEDGTSLWSNSTFTTGNFCETPHELEATNITYNAATLNWAGSQESYNLQYRTAEVTEEYYFYDFNAGYDAAHEAGWNWEGTIIYGFDDPIYNIPGDDNYFLQMGWATTNETYIFSPELPEYESGSLLEFYYFGYSTANTFQVGYSTTTNDTLSFTWGEPIDAPLQTYTKFSEELPAGTKYVAFKTTASEQSAAIFIDNFHIYKVMAAPGEWVTVENVTEPYELTGLTAEKEYEWQIQGINEECGELEWVAGPTFTTLEQTTVEQVIALSAGPNWFSTYVDITLDDLKSALVSVVPSNSTITIKSATQNIVYSRGRWNGTLDWDVANMYIIIVPAECEITLEGMPLNPEEHPITIAGDGNPTWIGFPFSSSMTVTAAFDGFAVNGDIIKSSNSNSQYSRGRWNGSVTNLEPGHGYIYVSAPGSADRTLVYPAR